MGTRNSFGGNTMHKKGLAEGARTVLCLFMAALLAITMTPFVPQAEAAQNEPTMTVMMTMPDGRTADVTKVVMTLNGGDKAPVKFKVTSNASPQSRTGWLVYELVDDDGSRDGRVLHHGGPEFSVTLDKIVASRNLHLRVLEADNKNPSGIVLYSKMLNIRIADTKKAESQVSSSGWSISNGLNITLNGSAPGGFFKDTKLVISPISLPVTYKHNPDGTTIVGINCNANDMAFYKAVKNKNVWQKYSDKALNDMAKGINKGMSGKGVGTWGGKGQDWSIAGFAEFNTKNPEAPWSVTLVGTAGIKYSQSAQYFCLTGTVTGGAGVKFLGSLIRNPKADTYSGYLDGGGYGTIELFGGIGAGTIAAVGIYGRGRLEVMLGLLPKSNFGFKTVSVSGDAGLKAVAFGFDIVRWVVFEPKNSPYYIYDRDKKKAAPPATRIAQDDTPAPAATPADVSADAVYPELSRDYLNDDSTWMGGDLAAGSSDALSAQATTLVKNIYGATDLVCAETKSGPVVAYIADAEQVDVKGRDPSNRSVLVYSRYQSDGTWSKPMPIDVKDSTYGKTPDYNPAIFAFPDSDDFYVAWLDARSTVSSGETFGEIVRKLDVRYAKVRADDTTGCQTVFPKNGIPAPSGVSYGAPSLFVQKVSGTDPVAYVGWATNEATGDEGQVIGTSGKHDVYLACKTTSDREAESNWENVRTSTDSGAITSLDVGIIGDKPSVAWSVDRTYASRCKKAGSGWSTVTMEELSSLNDSTAYKMTTDYGSTGAAPRVEKIADNATGIQAITCNGTPTMVYTTWARADEGGNFCSIYNANGNSLLLDGTTVGLPTPLTKIAGDIGKGANEGMVTCMRTTNAASVASLVKSGTAAKDWGKMVEATNAKGNITSYDVVYHNGAPMVVYSVAAPLRSSAQAQSDGALSAQADDSEETTSLEVASGTALKDPDIEGVYYDEIEVNAGQVMPVSVDFTNDSIVPLDGVDLYLYNETLESQPSLVASTSDTVQPGDTGTVSFELQLPEKAEFDKEMHYYVYVAPKGTAGVTAETIVAEGDDSLNFKLGNPHLALETEHHLIDGQESVVATVTNEGMVTSKPATLVFEESESGNDLESVEVPALAEGESFTYEHKAPEGYFQNTGITDLTIMLEDPNDPDDAYSLYNSDSIHTWDLEDDEAPAATKATSAAPRTGDDFSLGLVLLLVALATLTSPFVIRRIREAREG